MLLVNCNQGSTNDAGGYYYQAAGTFTTLLDHVSSTDRAYSDIAILVICRYLPQNERATAGQLGLSCTDGKNDFHRLNA